MRLSPLSSRRGGFVLLEVIVSMVILGISLATMMRSFTISMAAIRANDVSTQSYILAETLLQSIEADPPYQEELSGDFEHEGYPEYSWELTLEELDVDYPNVGTSVRPDDLKSMTKAHLIIVYDDGINKPQTPVDVDLILPPVERFSYESKFRNELFMDEEGI